MAYPKLLSLRGHHFYTRMIDKDSIVVDLGANRGDFSAQITSLFGCKSYAVEASPKLITEIPDNPLIKKFNYVINRTNEPVKFNLSLLNDECSSINYLPDEMNQETVTLEGVTLRKFLDDNSLRNVDLLKVDIEGAEIELFDSLSDETICSMKQITVEFHDFVEYFDMAAKVQNIKDRLSKLDFYCIVYSLKSNADVLFLNKRYCNISNLEYVYLKYINKYARGVLRRLGRMIEESKSKN
jgi:FkbM family methyltransferase